MSLIEQINNSTSEEIIIKLIEEQVIDEETSLGWGEEADIFERNGKLEKAEILRAAKKRCFELEQC
ncbi:MAG: hypothetical protein QM479_15380 [Pseudomonadota bacterium]